jgi:hypothetical protein
MIFERGDQFEAENAELLEELVALSQPEYQIPNSTFDNYRVKIQIEKGSAATAWEPYRGVSATVENVQTLMLEKGLNYIASTPNDHL